MGKVQLSYSSLKDYMECPRKFYYRKEKGLPPSLPAVVSHGQAFHRALERFYAFAISNKNKEIDWHKVAEDIINKALDEEGIYDDRKETKEAFLNYVSGIGEHLLRDIIGIELKLGADIVTPHQLKPADFDTADIRGVIDKLYFLPEKKTIVIADYKTGNAINYDKEQALFYALLVSANYQKLGLPEDFDHIVALFEFPRHIYEISFELDGEEILSFLAFISACIERIEAGGYDTPSVGEHCIVCPYRGLCEAVKDEMAGLPEDLTVEALLEEYFRLQAKTETVKALLQQYSADKNIVVDGYEIGYRERKSYDWDIDKAVEYAIANNSFDVLSVNSRKALKNDVLVKEALKKVKKSTVWGVYKAKKS